MSSSLGDRRGQHAPPPVHHKPVVIQVPADTPPSLVNRIASRLTLRRALPRSSPATGALAYLLVAGLFAAATALFCYHGIVDDVDYATGPTRALTLGTAVLAAIVVLFARDVRLLAQIVYFTHLGLEVYVVDLAFAYAHASRGATRSTLAYVGGSVVVAHLVPFLVYDGVRVLSALAFVGVVVNALLLLYTAPALGPQLLLPVGLTSVGLLGVVARGGHASLWSIFREQGVCKM